MALDWLPRDYEKRDHALWGEEHWQKEPPCTRYEKKPIIDPDGHTLDGLYTAWITLDNTDQLNSYTTEMVKGVIAGFQSASLDSSLVAVVFTGAVSKAFCSGGNTKEYVEYSTK